MDVGLANGASQRLLIRIDHISVEVAVNQLGTSTDSDYWKATPGNAGHALNILLYWAKMHPNYVFEGTT